MSALLPSDTSLLSSPARGRLARFREWLDRPDSAALHGLVSGAVWFVLGTSLGMIASDELVLPDLFAGIPQLVFSRLRPAHVNIMLFGFLSTAFFGTWYYMVPRLCNTPLRSNRAANILLLLWNLTIIAGTLALVNGDSQGKEYSEYPWYIDWPVTTLMVVNIFIVFGTILARREPKLYVSLWYIGGSVIWIAMMYAIGNVIWHPLTTYTTMPDGQFHVSWNDMTTVPLSLPPGHWITNYQRSGSFLGLDDAVWNWFYGHNVFGLYITTGGIAIIYYLMPKLTKRPLYSHTMSLIGFWSIALLYAPTGQHHLLQVPIANWLKVIAIIGSVGLIIPVFTQQTNVFMTMRGQWGQMLQNIPLRFLMTGSFFYLAVSFQGCVQSLMSVNRFIHFTQWTVAHAHLALLGAFGFITSSALLYMVPQIVRRPLWSANLADAQYWLMMLGIMGYFWSITAAGLAQASAWVNMGETVIKSVNVVKPYFALRSVFGGMVWVGAWFQLYNLYMTIRAPVLDAAMQRRRSLAALQEIPAASAFDDRTAVID